MRDDAVSREYARRLCEYAEARGRERAILEEIYSYVKERRNEMSYDEVDSLRESVSDAQSKAAIKRIREACIEAMADERKEVDNLKKVIREAQSEIARIFANLNEMMWRYDCAVRGEQFTEEFIDE